MFISPSIESVRYQVLFMFSRQMGCAAWLHLFFIQTNPMFEEDGFVYKRLSIGKKPFEGPPKKQQLKKTKSDTPFFSFKFVNKKENNISVIPRKRVDGGEELYSGALGMIRKHTESTVLERVSHGTAGKQIVYKPVDSNKIKESQRRLGRADKLIKDVKFDALPTMKDPLKLHMFLSSSDTLDSLTALVVDFLKKRLQKPPKFLDLLKSKVEVPNSSLKEDIERLKMDIADMDLDIKRWEEVSCALRKSNVVSIDFSFQDYRVEEAKARTERIRAIRDAFREKEAQLMLGLKVVERIVENVQVNCEAIFKKIFRLVERSKGYDSFVLLKAISNLGKLESSVQT
eukprot:jgi/Antlo1/2269/1415